MKTTITISSLPSLAFGCLMFSVLSGTAADPVQAKALEARAQVVRLQRQSLELNAQIALLKELSAQHDRLAEEARKADQPDRAKWEDELARTLSQRTDSLAAASEETQRRRQAAQESARTLAAEAAGQQDADESAFLTQLNARLEHVDLELKTVIEANGAYAAQLQTNSAPEEMYRVSALAQENNVLVRFLEREKSDLELKRLQYRALKSLNKRPDALFLSEE